MKADKVTKVARFCTSEEVQRWSSNMGRFVAALHPLLNAEMRKACNACPFRNNISVGGGALPRSVPFTKLCTL